MIDVSGDSVRQSQHALTLTPTVTLSLTLNLNPNPVTLRTRTVPNGSHLTVSRTILTRATTERHRLIKVELTFPLKKVLSTQNIPMCRAATIHWPGTDQTFIVLGVLLSSKSLEYLQPNRICVYYIVCITAITYRFRRTLTSLEYISSNRISVKYLFPWNKIFKE